jgi:hemimethylated DNA binding protein
MMHEHFQRFDPPSNSFVMNDMLAYEYPVDHEMQQHAMKTKVDDSDKPLDAAKEAEEARVEAQELAAQWEEFIVLPENHTERQELRLLWAFQKRFNTLSTGALESETPLIHGGVHNLHGNVLVPENVPPVTSACAYLRQLLNISLEIRDILFHRRSSQNASSQMNFSLGDVVYHKVFGFRGVVVAFDHRPSIDVSRWDGVQHIDNPLELPFYHIVPDQQDCLEIFGSERGMRYVCEENLEPCYKNRSAVTVPHMDPDWTRRGNPDGATVFEAPPEIKFKHGIDIGDDNITEHCLGKVQVCRLLEF